MIRIGFIGAGLIGRERVRAVDILMREGKPLEPIAIMDPFSTNSAELAASVGATTVTDINALLATKPDWVVVATPHDTAFEIIPVLCSAGIKVLAEKPLGRSLREAEIIAGAVPPDHLWIGHNYRFYEGIAALMADIQSQKFGVLTSMSLLLGHGGGPKDQGTWKLDPERAGGGVTIDPGIHLFDLINLIEAQLPQIVGGTTWSGFWQTGIEEDVHVLLKGAVIPSYSVNVSLVRWRSCFRLEVHGVEGYGVVEGRGRSYGPQRYWRGRRWGWQQHPTQAASEEVIVETDGVNVFADEMRALLFQEKTAYNAYPCSLPEALANMRLLDAVRATLKIKIP